MQGLYPRCTGAFVELWKYVCIYIYIYMYTVYIHIVYNVTPTSEFCLYGFRRTIPVEISDGMIVEGSRGIADRLC